MQTQSKSPVVVTAAPDAMSTLVRTIIALLATATLLFLFRPTVIHAQDKTAPHTVTAGETLWSLATRFYGDGQKWAELAKLNGLGEAGEKQLVVGQVIKVPAAKASTANSVAIAPPPNTPRPALQRAQEPPRPAANEMVSGSAPGVLAQQTAGKADAAPKTPVARGLPASSRNVAPVAPAPAGTFAAKTPGNPSPGSPKVAPVIAPLVETAAGTASSLAAPIDASTTSIWAVDLPALRAARGADQTTVFLGLAYDPVGTDIAVKAASPVIRVRERAGEYSSAPYAVAATSLSTTGAVGRRSGSAGGSFRDIERLVLMDE
ncbi:MAG: LysM peptidoglycan-binding domain-containing protein, partial [Phycisphaerae bacterium]|nr:LysM peptidoglycan-binding domain-containing protein [Gemmatimonadaceae bacterium]